MIEIIHKFLESAPENAGVYRMFDDKGHALYVGKAKNLRKRIANYTDIKRNVPRIQRMIIATYSMELTSTRTEAEALLLEANLIKKLKPRYNILLRDDKSFPYIAISDRHKFPRIMKHRGSRKQGFSYYGPYASAGGVNSAISTLQKAFLLRPCTDSVFSSRNRPCMEYQIKRCSAPCVEKISDEEYIELVSQTKKFLTGKSSDVQKSLIKEMEEASDNLEYEKATIYRDRIRALSHIQAKQNISSKTIIDGDIVALTSNGNKVCIQIFFIRNGEMLGNKPYFPSQTEGYNINEIMEAFLANFYQNNTPPPTIISSHDIFGKIVLEEALSELANRKVTITIPLKGEKRELVEMAIENAKEALSRKVKEQSTEKELLKKTAEIFDIEDEIKRIEIFDNSHIFGKNAVGGMVVAGEEGFMKESYRKFNVDSGAKNTGGDDYYMMRQVLTRRYGRLKKEDATFPDLILIDGGAGHLTIAKEVFKELEISIPFVCIAKGEDRNAGREDFYMEERETFTLPPDDPVMYYLQRLRDEAHRFAIGVHRKKRAADQTKSVLDEISGIGAARKRALLNHFGSATAIAEATLQELEKINGINKKTAKVIFDYMG